ncbi:MAG: hypothetical protein M1816_000601 [Peltula sp. TS41687]|nr:MAG: hypothetical protein M1816_000601 [Peltula sp. TS41687]
MISCRFFFYPSAFKLSFLHPTESLFIPASAVSFGTVLLNISQYGVNRTGAWLNTAVMIFFWLEACMAIILCTVIYLILWSTTEFTVARMTPIWVFPAYPLLIIGPHAATLSSSLSPTHSFQIILAGFTIQALGFMISLMIYSAYIYRLMTHKLPRESSRPGMFVSIGPSGFTVSAVLGMATNLDRAIPADFMGPGKGPLAALILRSVATFVGLGLWGCVFLWSLSPLLFFSSSSSSSSDDDDDEHIQRLAIWFFLVSIFAHYSCVRPGRFHFSMTWFSFVFPNTALVAATFAVGKALDAKPVQIVGCVLAVALVLVWLFVVAMMCRAVYRREILWPQTGEERDAVGDGFQVRGEGGRGIDRRFRMD